MFSRVERDFRTNLTLGFSWNAGRNGSILSADNAAELESKANFRIELTLYTQIYPA